eukprot:365520-Chlamydomonas_euryale.AAC.11
MSKDPVRDTFALRKVAACVDAEALWAHLQSIWALPTQGVDDPRPLHSVCPVSVCADTCAEGLRPEGTAGMLSSCRMHAA